MTERRKECRREADDEAYTIAETSVANSWFVVKLMRWGKIVSAVGIMLVFINGVLGALNIRMVGSRDDVKALRTEMIRGDSTSQSRGVANSMAIAAMRQTQDSMVTLLTKMNARMERQEITLCLTQPRLSGTSMCNGAKQ